MINSVYNCLSDKAKEDIINNVTNNVRASSIPNGRTGEIRANIQPLRLENDVFEGLRNTYGDIDVESCYGEGKSFDLIFKTYGIDVKTIDDALKYFKKYQIIKIDRALRRAKTLTEKVKIIVEAYNFRLDEERLADGIDKWLVWLFVREGFKINVYEEEITKIDVSKVTGIRASYKKDSQEELSIFFEYDNTAYYFDLATSTLHREYKKKNKVNEFYSFLYDAKENQAATKKVA